MEKKPIVDISNLTKHFPGMKRPALSGLSMKIYPGHITGLVGPDGAGKTTLIRLLTGLMHADHGTIHVCGYESTHQSQSIHKILGYMPQKFGLYEDLSVIENLELYAELRGVPLELKQEKFKRLLSFTGLAPFQQRRVGQLSGGMKQKLGLACALIGEPRLLLLDEPSVGVDPISRRELWRMVKELLNQGISVLWSTAYLDEAEKCDSVLLINEGKNLFSGPPSELLKRVEGRTFHIEGIPTQSRRLFLTNILNQDSILDGIIEGRKIRVLTKDLVRRPQLYFGSYHNTPAIFEDGFIDILGGGPGGDSLLAKKMDPKPLTPQPIVEAMGLYKNFGDFCAVKNNSFSIHRGEIFGLLGPNGAGKSTTFKMLCGLLQPSQGIAKVMGYSLKESSAEARQRIGYMAQKFSLYGHLSVIQNLKFFSGLYGLHGSHQKEMIDMMVSIFELQPYLKQSTGPLPLGFKQRLALACSVMHEPDVLFLDEPTSGVDPITRREFWTHINGMVEKGVTIMVTTHFMDEAQYCDRIGLIYRGENIATGTPDELKSMVQTSEVPDPNMETAFITLIENHDKVLKDKGLL